jgi:putative transposase
MGRSLRAAAGNVIYHVLNRANARRTIFEKPGDFAAFERVIGEAHARGAMRILAYCLMPNHWHLVLWPSGDGDLTRFMAWVTLTHTQRWHAHRGSAGTGHVYQGRFKSFPVQEDEHFLTICRYVERNALRAGLVARAEDWRWSSLWRRTHGDGTLTWLAPWPMEPPSSWLDWVNQPQTATELECLRESVQRSRPYGTGSWARETAEKLRLVNALRLPGRLPRLQEHDTIPGPPRARGSACVP